MKLVLFLATVLGIGAAVASAGCMTMMRGTTEAVRFESNPPDAQVVVERAGFSYGACNATPCAIMLKRKVAPFDVTFTKEGCQPQTLALKRDHATGKGLASNMLGAGALGGVIGAGVGAGVDAASGAAYSIVPNPLVAKLECEPP